MGPRGTVGPGIQWVRPCRLHSPQCLPRPFSLPACEWCVRTRGRMGSQLDPLRSSLPLLWPPPSTTAGVCSGCACGRAHGHSLLCSWMGGHLPPARWLLTSPKGQSWKDPLWSSGCFALPICGDSHLLPEGQPVHSSCLTTTSLLQCHKWPGTCHSLSLSLSS